MRRSDPHELAENMTYYIDEGASDQVIVGPAITQNGKTYFEISMPGQKYEVTVRLKAQGDD